MNTDRRLEDATEDNETDQALSFPQINHVSVGVIISVGLILAATLSYAILAILLWSYTVDDAYITFRYAANFAQGWGLTFNQYPPRAEGYTSILWTLIMAFPHLVQWDATFFSKLFGVGSILGCLCLMVFSLLTAPEGIERAPRLFGSTTAIVLFLTFSFGPVHSISGMETAFAAFLYTFIAVLFFKVQDGESHTPLLALACLLLGLVRPEANLFAATLLIIAFIFLPSAKRLRFAIWCLALYVLPGIAYFVWRYNYYGLLMPLPFYIKSSNSGLNGLGETFDFLKALALSMAFPLIIFATTASIKRALILVPIALILGYLSYISHVMGFGFRYFYPLVPVFSLLAGFGAMQFASQIQTPFDSRIGIAFLLFIGLGAAFGVLATLATIRGNTTYARGLDAAHITIGRTLASIPWSEEPLIAVSDAGALPYYSELETIDLYGLNDPNIALETRGDRQSDRAEYVLSQEPAVIVLISQFEDIFDSPLAYEDTLYQSISEAGYDRHASYTFSDGYYLWAVWNSDSPDAPALEEMLNNEPSQSHMKCSVPSELGYKSSLMLPN